MASTFHTTRMVQFADTDMAGIAHFSSFFRFMEEAEHAFLRSHGLSVVMEWEGIELAFPRVAAQCDFERPVRFEEVIDIAVTLEKIGKSSLTYSVLFTRDSEPIARGRLTCVCCRVLGEGRIEAYALPPSLRARLEAAEAN
jgi:YbgC/YbaW family acyl-CoA thioester hydrolase